MDLRVEGSAKRKQKPSIEIQVKVVFQRSQDQLTKKGKQKLEKDSRQLCQISANWKYSN